jgi:AraC family transcriptional regulator
VSPEVRYRHRINRAIDYVEQNLAGDTSLETLASIAGFSPFHFHRVFASTTGETIHDFVTRLRFERAIALIRATPRKSLTDIALEAGFRSSSNFSRKFAQRFAMKPSSLRDDDSMRQFLQSIRDVSRATAIENLNDSDERVPYDVRTLSEKVRVESWPVLPIAYVRVTGGYLAPDTLIAGYRRIEDWAEAECIPRGNSRLIGMSIDDPAVVSLAKCRYDFCRETKVNPKARSGVTHRTLSASDWAVLPCSGDLTDVNRCWTYLFREWLPQSGWQPAAMPAVEVFHRRPEEIGWDRFDMDCCLPIEPLIE